MRLFGSFRRESGVGKDTKTRKIFDRVIYDIRVYIALTEKPIDIHGLEHQRRKAIALGSSQ